MANLTETAYYTRRTINWTILGVIIYIILRVAWSFTSMALLVMFPPKAPPPNHGFAKLPALVFPKPQGEPKTLTFQLDTIQGTLPEASPSATVYFMPKKQANLLALNKTQEFARRLSFDPAPIQESKTIYRFEDPEFALRKLRYDIITDNFIVRFGYEQDLQLFADRNLLTMDAAASQARAMLQTYGLYQDDIARGIVNVLFLKLSGSQLIQTTSQSQADAVRVDFIRRSINGIAIATPFPDEGAISIIFSGSKIPKKRIIQFAYTFWPVDYLTSATYGLKSTNGAWRELQNGRGYIARYPQRGNVAVVRTVKLAYYDSFEPQTYLQPVFMFEGDDGFLGYVPAVAPPWIDEQPIP